MPHRVAALLMLLALLTAPFGTAGAQAADSVPVLTFADFARQVRATHPVARQAALVRAQAREELRAARGAFDPTVTASLDQKTFGGALYYNYAQAELKVPTPVGSDVS